MDGQHSIQKKSRREIRDVGKILLWGGNPLADEEITTLYNKWRFFFDTFLTIVDRKNGNWMHLPFNVSASEQPYTTMQVLEAIRSLYFERLEELNKPNSQK